MTDVANRLPDGYSERAPTPDDLDAVTALVSACVQVDYGWPAYARENIQADWHRPGFDLATDARLILAPESQIVGYVNVRDAGDRISIDALSGVHPEHRHRGIGTYLVRWAEAWARRWLAEHAERAPIRLRAILGSNNLYAQRIVQQSGYQPAEQIWNLEIDMDRPPPAPEVPNGLTLRPFVPDQDARAVFHVIMEAFDHPLDPEEDEYEAWARWTIQRDDFDPGLWFVATEGEEIVAAALCYDEPDMGWVSEVGVRPAWRRLGLGLALLYQAFGTFYQRGQRKVGLGVSAENPTGAVRLYIRAGMHVTDRWNCYRKEMDSAINASTALAGTEYPSLS